jgi:hypothetical protein
MLVFEVPADHARVPGESDKSSANAPFHKFRWLHVPGSAHQGLKPFFGPYTYTVTARYFANGKLLPIDPAQGVSVDVDVGPLETKKLQVGFTRGYTQSQAFVRHFGIKAKFRPKDDVLIFDTTKVSGTNDDGEQYTYAQEYEWLGFTARERIFELLNEVRGDTKLRLDVFAYDLSEPDLMASLLQLAKEGRARVILDNAALHHSKDPKPGDPPKKAKPEDEFEKEFRKVAKRPDDIMRGKFGRYAHDKVFVVRNAGGALKVMTGSTNFSVTGLYVNSNHVLVFNDPAVAGMYATVFDTVWETQVKKPAFLATHLSKQAFPFGSAATPPTSITFAPHDPAFVKATLDEVVARIDKEGTKAKGTGSVLFAVMQTDQSTSQVYTSLRDLHANERIFSYGISDTANGVELYDRGSKKGVLVTGKPAKTQLPPPFSQVPGVGLGHQVHHKFVVCGFNGDDPIVFCGSSNLAPGGEANNGDNLLAIRDPEVATAFALEALGLVDHFSFLDRMPAPKKDGKKAIVPPPAVKDVAAAKAGWHLSTTDRWAAPYFDSADLRSVDRKLFA